MLVSIVSLQFLEYALQLPDGLLIWMVSNAAYRYFNLCPLDINNQSSPIALIAQL